MSDLLETLGRAAAPGMRGMKAASIGELEGPPKVGKMYLVPMVYVPAGVPQFVDPPLLCGWWPTMGPGHTDPGIPGGELWHFHLDARFLSKEQVRNRLKFQITGSARLEHLWAAVIGGPAVSALRVRTMPLVCQRRAPRHPLDCPDVRLPVAWPAELERQMAGKRLKCLTCPHRGVHVGSVRAAKDGGVTCPGHGLRWNRETGELMPRSPEQHRQFTSRPEPWSPGE